MPSQQRFEGPDLEALLDDVRGRFGAGVNIVEANKIRKGGVGGFFTKELFEVFVEVDDAADAPVAPRPAPAVTPRPRTLLDLVDEVDDGPPPAEDEAIAPTGPSMSTDGAAFAAVLERIARATEEPPLPDEDPEVDEPFRSFAEAPPNGRATATVDTRVPQPRPEQAPYGDRPAPRPADHIGSEVAATDEPGSLLVAERPMVERPAAARPRPDATPARGDRSTALARPLDLGALRDLGFPAPLLQGANPQVDRLHALVELAERFPRPRRLPETGDTVIALVGDRAGMQRAAAWVNDRLGLPPDRLMLASRAATGVFPSHRRMSTSDEAAARRGAWRRSPRPVLVVVDDPVDVDSSGWSRHVLDALEPAAVWGVVDAHRKPEDVVNWAERIGGVDALVMEGTRHTVSPAAILATGLPVSLIDGTLATPNRWASVLDERLQAA